jgi:hypothetical protein
MWLQLQGVDRDEFLSYLGVGLNALFTSRSEGRRWLDHTPHYALVSGTLARVFPGAKFIHILRDGREVVNSMLSFADSSPDPAMARWLRKTVPWTTGFREACETWRDYVESVTALRRDYPERVFVLRHEELVSDPEVRFRAVHQFLALADEAGPAHLVRTKRINSSFDGGGRRSGDSVWDTWDDARRRTFAEVAGETLVGHGYVTWNQLGSIAESSVGDVGGPGVPPP